MKIPALEGVITVRGDQDLARQTELEALSLARHVHTVGQDKKDQPSCPSAKWAPKPRPHGQLRRVPLEDSAPEKTVNIGAELPAETHSAILGILCSNRDVFAWGLGDILGVACATIEHRLALQSNAPPKKQKLRRMSADRLEAAKKQITKLLTAGVIREIKYTEWLANPVLVQKEGKWRMFVDYTDLNKA